MFFGITKILINDSSFDDIVNSIIELNNQKIIINSNNIIIGNNNLKTIRFDFHERTFEGIVYRIVWNGRMLRLIANQELSRLSIDIEIKLSFASFAYDGFAIFSTLTKNRLDFPVFIENKSIESNIIELMEGIDLCFQFSNHINTISFFNRFINKLFENTDLIINANLISEIRRILVIIELNISFLDQDICNKFMSIKSRYI